MNNFEAKRQARLERFKELAEKHKQQAGQRFENASKMAACIPMGQPILVGHHSEKSDRAFRDRIDGNMRKGIDHENKAAHFENRAAAIENNSSILSDDPEAKQKLQEKIEKIERTSAEMKRINAHYKAHGTFPDDGDPALVKLGQENIAVWRGGRPFPQYSFTNLRGQVKNARQRLANLNRVNSFEPFEINGIKVDVVEAQIQVSFSYKPNEETRTKLKSLAMKWSSYSKKWVRKYTGQGSWFFDELKKVLENSAE